MFITLNLNDDFQSGMVEPIWILWFRLFGHSIYMTASIVHRQHFLGNIVNVDGTLKPPWALVNV